MAQDLHLVAEGMMLPFSLGSPRIALLSELGLWLHVSG